MTTAESQAIKRATPDYEILPELAERFSPVCFDGKPLADGVPERLFEAMRWAPSSMNEQPWRVVFAGRESPEFDAFVGFLAEGNQPWARHAGMLMCVAAATTFARSGKENRHAWHDVGLALGTFLQQLRQEGLHCHFMGGFSRTLARETLHLPDTVEPVVCVAVGRHEVSGEHDPSYAKRDGVERTRRPQSEWAFEGRYA